MSVLQYNSKFSLKRFKTPRYVGILERPVQFDQRGHLSLESCSVRLHSKSHQKSFKCQNLFTNWHLELLGGGQLKKTPCKIQHHKWVIPSIMVSHCAEKRGRKGGSILMLRHASATVSVTLLCNTNTRQKQDKYNTDTRQLQYKYNASNSVARQFNPPSLLLCSDSVLFVLLPFPPLTRWLNIGRLFRRNKYTNIQIHEYK